MEFQKQQVFLEITTSENYHQVSTSLKKSRLLMRHTDFQKMKMVRKRNGTSKYRWQKMKMEITKNHLMTATWK